MLVGLPASGKSKLAETAINEYMVEIKHLKESFLEVVDENKIDYSIRDEFKQMSKDIIESKIIADIMI